MTSARACSTAPFAAAASSGYLPSSRKLRGCAMGSPCSSANCLIGEGCSFMPRPAGRSGCVKTSAISKPAPCRRSSATRANCGVPAKMTRNCLKSVPVVGSVEEFHPGVGALHQVALVQVDPVERIAALQIAPTVGHDRPFPAGDAIDPCRPPEFALHIVARPLAPLDPVEVIGIEHLARLHHLAAPVQIDHPGIPAERLERVLEPLACWQPNYPLRLAHPGDHRIARRTRRNVIASEGIAGASEQQRG